MLNWIKEKLLIRPDFDALALAEKEPREDGRLWFALDPEQVYPRVLDRIKSVLGAGIEQPDELMDAASTAPGGAAASLVAQAKAVPPDGWRWARLGRDGFDAPDRIAIRAQALNVARLWFTQALHARLGGNGTAIGLHWLKGTGKYRL